MIGKMKAINKLFVVFVLMCLAPSADAQIAKWLVRLSYDHIEMTNSGLLKIVSDGKEGLLSVEGREVLPIDFDSISSFKEDRALLFKA